MSPAQGMQTRFVTGIKHYVRCEGLGSLGEDWSKLGILHCKPSLEKVASLC